MSNQNEITQLFEGCKNGEEQYVKSLLTRENVNAKDDYDMTCLMHAVKSSNSNVAKLLIMKGARLNEKDWIGLSALHHAKSIEMVKLLISEGAQIDIRNNRNFTPLMEALESDHVDIAHYLIEKGANVNTRTGDNQTPLYLAIYRGRKELVEELISRGASLDGPLPYKETFSEFAARCGYNDIVEILKTSKKRSVDSEDDEPQVISDLKLLERAAKALGREPPTWTVDNTAGTVRITLPQDIDPNQRPHKIDHKPKILKQRKWWQFWK